MGRSEKLTDRFLTLTSGQIFVIFIVFVFLGGFSIWSNINPQIICCGLIIAYTGILFIVQRKYFSLLSMETKNTPYFMGFLFTLFCLFVIFYNIPEISIKSSQMTTLLIPAIGTALLTTIVGLIGRQLIMSTDPTQEQHEKIFKLATEELKENVSVYRLSQQKLLDLIDEFTSSHTELLHHEKEASKDHIALLTESSKALAKLGRQYPPKVRKLIDTLDNIQKKFDEFINDNLASVHNAFVNKTTEHLEKMFNDFSDKGEELFSAMSSRLNSLKDKIDDFSASFEVAFDQFPEIQKKLFADSALKLSEFQNNYLDQLSGRATNINNEINNVQENLKGMSSVFVECNAIVNDGFRTNLKNVDGHLSEISSFLSSSKGTIKDINEGNIRSFSTLQEHWESLRVTINTFNETYFENIKLFKNELKEVDALIDTFIEVTKKRLDV